MTRNLAALASLSAVGLTAAFTTGSSGVSCLSLSQAYFDDAWVDDASDIFDTIDDSVNVDVLAEYTQPTVHVVHSRARNGTITNMEWKGLDDDDHPSSDESVLSLHEGMMPYQGNSQGKFIKGYDLGTDKAIVDVLWSAQIGKRRLEVDCFVDVTCKEGKISHFHYYYDVGGWWDILAGARAEMEEGV